MIVLDTNVLSELMRRHPDGDVLAWLDALPTNETYTTGVTAAELLYGVGRLPDGHRKAGLLAAVHGLLDDDFRGRVEAFDAVAADHYGSIVSHRDVIGRPISVADGQIAAICRKREAALATRHVTDFVHTGLELVDPWHVR